MPIRASSGGQLGGGGGGGNSTPSLTVEEIQDVVSEMTVAANTVTGLKLTPVYNDVTGKLTLSLATDSAPIDTVVPASIDIANSGAAIGAATRLNFTGSGIGSVNLNDDIATITVTGGAGGIEVSQDGGADSAVTSLNFEGATVSVVGNSATISIDGGNSSVSSVNGKSGTVILSTDEVSEGTLRQYFTNNRFDTRFNTKTTDSLSEGAGNLYFTNSRFDARLATKTSDNIVEGTTNQYFTNSRFDARFGTRTTDLLTEGSANRYFTEARARAAISAGTGITIVNGQISVANLPNSALANNSITVAGKTIALGGSAALSINDLSDVNTASSAPSVGQTLVWNGTNWVPGAPTAGTVTSVNGSTGAVVLGIEDLDNVDVSGVTNGEAIIWNGTKWVTGAPTAAGTVSSVNGLSGIVTLDSDDIAEGSTNLYYTNGRVDARIGLASLSSLADVAGTAPTTGQVLKWNGSSWAPATDLAGAGVSSVTCQIEYDASGNLTGTTVIAGTATATITNSSSSACEVTFEFAGATRPPLTTTVYGYQRASNVYVQRAVDANFIKRVVAGGGSSGSPTAFTAFNSAANSMVLSLTRALTGASAAAGQSTHCVVQFVLV